MSEPRGVAMRFHAGKRVTPANIITVLRIALAPVLFALIIAARDDGGASWPVFVLGTFLAFTDHYDGVLARRQGTTRSGAFLDPLADKIVVLGAMMCLVIVERYWWLPVALIAVREIGLTVMRSRYARRGLAIPARTSAKIKTLVQGIALLLAALPLLKDQRGVIVAALWIAVALTLYTGWQYLRDGAKGATTAGSLS